MKSDPSKPRLRTARRLRQGGWKSIKLKIVQFPPAMPVPAASRRVLNLVSRYPERTYAEIGAMCGCTRQHVYRCLREHRERIERFFRTGGKETRGRKAPAPKLIRQVVEMYKRSPATVVAGHFGISRSTVKLYAEKSGFRKRC